MSKEEEAPTRVTRGALRRMSVEQEPTSAPGTPKKTTAAAPSKKLAVLDAIQEGSNGPSDADEVEEDATARASKGAKKDTSLVGNRSVHRIKDQDKKPPASRSRAASLTQENIEQMESLQEIRRTPRRRPSQDQTLTPQTVPKRVTRRNSVTSDDGNLSMATPKASRTRHSVAAPAVIIEDVEKEEQANVSATGTTAEADLSDLDIRKLRNRSISNSPVPRGSPCSNKNLSTAGGGSETSSPVKLEVTSDTVNVSPSKTPSVVSVAGSSSNEEVTVVAAKEVTFDEGTPDQLNKSKYPKTPVAAASGEKRRKLSEKADESLTTTASEVIIINETIKDSPQETPQKTPTPKSPTKASGSPKKASNIIIIDETIKDSPDQKTASPKTPSKASSGTPKKATQEEHSDDESPDKTLDASIANMVEQVREEMNQSADLSMSILGTPKPVGVGKGGKSHFSHLREGSSSTPIASGKHAAAPLEEIPEEEQKTEEEEAASKSWGQAVKGSGKGKGIDVFSVRKQEEEKKQEEEVKALNESLKRKSLEKKRRSSRVEEEEDDEDDEEEEDEEDEIRNTFVDDEAMEVDDYESGDSMDSEARAEMEDNAVEDHGESIGSQDTDAEDEEDDDDSFIASDGEEEDDLLDGTGDDLHSEEEEKTDKRDKKKKRKRIIQQVDSSDEEQADKTSITLDETNASESKSPKKNDSSKRLNTSKVDSPRKTPGKTVEAKSPKKTPAKKSPEDEEVEEKSVEDLNSSNANNSSTQNKTPKKNTSVEQVPETPKSAKKTPGKATSSQEVPESPKSPKKTPGKVISSEEVPESPRSPKKTPSKLSALQEVPESPRSPKKTPGKAAASEEVPESPKSSKKTPSKPTEPKAESKEAKSAEKRSAVEASDASKSRKSLPAPALLVSADFYSSSAKKAKRNTLNDTAVNGSGEEKSSPEEDAANSSTKEALSNMVTNPAALALARKNKRLTQGLSPEGATKQDKRASLPGKLPVERELDSPLKKKKKAGKKEEDEVEPMEVDEEEEAALAEPSPKKPVVAKKKPKDLSEFDTEAILARCNEIVREDKVKRKDGATLRQKKKDEKRRQREQEKQAEAAEGEADASMEQPKKKKKKKKQVNYLLEELGETKEDQVARALQRKMALLEAKRERKKAKKAAKLRQQLDKENQNGDKPAEGITAKLEKKAKKAKKAEKEAVQPVVEEAKPVVKRAVSAFAMYSEQIEELKKTQADKKKPKSKQLKEKNQQPPTAVEEVQAALQSKSDSKAKKDKSNKQKQAKTEENAASEVAPPEGEHSKVDKQKEVAEVPVKEVVSEKQKKKDKPSAVVSEEPSPKKKKIEQVNTAPLKSVASFDDELAQLKKSLSDPVTKVVKKQKLSHKESSTATAIVREVTPPPKPTSGKLKALSRLEAGFQEEPVTPDHKLLKRNHGFKEEPVTPKSVGFKVSSVLPAGQEALKQEAIVAKKKKTYPNSNRIRPEDVKEPAKGLALPVWTRSGAFVEEELEEAKSKKSARNGGDYVPLSVNGGGHSATEFLVKPLGGSGKSKREDKTSGGGVSKAHRIDLATVDEAVLNFKKQAIFGKNAHLREKKSKH